MTEAAAEAPLDTRARFRVGAVLGRALDILRHHPLVFVPLGALSVVPSLLDRASPLGRSLGVTPGVAFVISVLDLPFGFIVQATMIYGAFQAMRGQEVRLGASLRHGFSRFFPVLGAAIGVSLAIGLGLVLLVVPGLVVMTMLAVTVPACVVERLRPLASMERSGALTKGHRWKVFGIILVPAIVVIIAAQIDPVVLMPIGGATMVALGAVAVRALAAAYDAVVTVVAYHDLRVAKEGIDIERIAAVFD